MIILRANDETKVVFNKMIHTMGENVKWKEIFVINNNDVILAGKGKSLFFNFDNRRSRSNIVDLPIEEDKIGQTTSTPLLENALNMILYAFGKWGGIKGLKVETPYNKLNSQFNYIFSEIEIEVILTKDFLHFYKGGIKITYEEVVEEIISESNVENEKEEEEIGSDENIESEIDDEHKEYEIGLWHNVKWKTEKLPFHEIELTEAEKKIRLGKNFYKVPYKCPICSEKISMVVYPEGKEFRVETDEEGVYLARAYTCKECNHFFATKPHTMLTEGEVYTLFFEDDQVAYEDYLELLGKKGERTSNYNFNEYESDYLQKNKGTLTMPSLERIDGMESMTDEDIELTKEKMSLGFFPQKDVERYYAKIDEEIKKRKVKKKPLKVIDDKKKESLNAKKSTSNERNLYNSEKVSSVEKDVVSYIDENSNIQLEANKEEYNNNISINHDEGINVENTVALDVEDIKPKKDEVDEFNIENISPSYINKNKKNTPHIDKPVKKEKLKVEKDRQNSNKTDKKDKQEEALTEDLKEVVTNLLKGDMGFLSNIIEKMNDTQINKLKGLILSDNRMNEKDKQKHTKYIDEQIYSIRKRKLLQKADSYKSKSYVEISRLIEEVKNDDLKDEDKKSILESLKKMLHLKADIELKNLIMQIPENITRKQYNQYKDKIEEYKEVDKSYYRKYLDDRRDAAEKGEIVSYIKRFNANDRKSWYELYKKLKDQDFSYKNLKPYLEKINDKIYKLDEDRLKNICPEPAELSFEEGLKKYEEISSGDYLPKLKMDYLDMIEKRLKKIKMDECELLINKLEKEMTRAKIDNSRIYYYNVRKRVGKEDVKSIIVDNAINTYGSDLEEYEYPILICDSSNSENGTSGFILTGDHIYYSGLLSSGTVEVKGIDKITVNDGIFQKGIYVHEKEKGKAKVCNLLDLENPEAFVKVLNTFIEYLKEKPKSREVSYLSKEKHKTKCCIRCGHRYTDEDVCPKCGEKSNK